jgi:SAM-dependent methyltransferase
VLNVGSGSGITVEALRQQGFDAYGIESSRLAHARTLETCREFNLLGDPTDLPFEDGSFDVVIESSLCDLPRENLADAIAEMRRVARLGVMVGSIVSDLNVEMIERHDLLANVKTFASRWDWADEFFAQGFGHALTDPDRLAEVWKCAQATGAGPGHWYEDPEGLLYCFYNIESLPAFMQQPQPEPVGKPGYGPQSFPKPEAGQTKIATLRRA